MALSFNLVLASMDEVIKSLREVAQSSPVIRRMWIFGSRYKGTNTDDSDLDIAVEVEWVEGYKLGYCADAFSLWAAAAPHFEEELRQCSPWTMDLQQYAGSAGTPRIHRYLREGSVLLYEKT